MPNIGCKIKRNNLEEQINESGENGIFDIHYAESENCSLVRSREGGYRYVIKYSPEYEILIIWNRNAQKYSVSFTWTQLNEYLQHEYCKVLYERRRKNNYDKVVAIRRDFLPAFLEDYDAFMRYNEFDFIQEVDRTKISDLVDWGDAKERTVRSVLQKARDYKFRIGVLDRYKYQCAICRCNIPQLLDAAHERSYEVCKTDFDMIEHGICLCKNHHAMYDAKTSQDDTKYLIDIDLKNCTITVNEEEIKLMPWYEVFMKDYGGKIKKPL